MVARGMLKPVYFAFVQTMLEFFLQTTHLVKSRAHSPRPTSKIIAVTALTRAILMKAHPVVSLLACSAVAHVHAKKTPVPRTDDFLRTKISWMHRLPNFLIDVASRARELRYKKKTDFQAGLQTSHFRLLVNSCEKVSILYQLLTFFLLCFLFLFSKIRLSSFYKANTFKG